MTDANDHDNSVWRKLPAILFRVSVALIAAVFIVEARRADFFDPVAVKALVTDFGTFAPLIWVVLYLPAVFVPYATTVMTVAAGLAFGAVPGGILVFCTTVFASLIPFSVSRRLGRKRIERKLGDTRVSGFVDAINRHAFLVFFYLRLLPTVPYEIQNYIAGVTRITMRQFFLASLLGNAPVLFVMTFFGESLSDPGSRQFWIAAILYTTALVLPLLFGVQRRIAARKHDHSSAEVDEDESEDDCPVTVH